MYKKLAVLVAIVLAAGAGTQASTEKDDATGINDKGQIVVNGSNAMRQEHAFLLNPS